MSKHNPERGDVWDLHNSLILVFRDNETGNLRNVILADFDVEGKMYLKHVTGELFGTEMVVYLKAHGRYLFNMESVLTNG